MSRLAEMQARFQQKQMQEKEEKLLRLYENQQQRAFDRVGRGSAGSNTSVGSTGGGKVRQMFDERRQKAGVDKSYPLEPLRGGRTNGSLDRQRNTTTRTVVKSTVQKSVSSVRYGKPTSKREVVHSIYNNNNGVESYEEHRYDDDNYKSPSFDLIEIMNKNNISDNLDDEELPRIGFDEVDEPFIRGKLANVGGKLPSQAASKRVESKVTVKSNGATPVIKKEAKPPVARNVRKTTTSRTVSTPPSKPTTPMKNRPKDGDKESNTSEKKVPNAKTPSKMQTTKQGPPIIPRDDLVECKICHRRFAEDRLAVHESICMKASTAKRKKYDATKHRLQGTDLEQYGRKILKTKSSGKTLPKKDWRKTHEEFISAIRNAKMTQQHLAKGGKLSDLPPPPPSSNPDYVQCPHCGRKFNEAAAERHIPKCANYQFNKPSPAQKRAIKK